MVNKNRIPVNNIMCCSAGGIGAAFFTAGSIKCLLDNNNFLNTFDIISASSGSVIPIILTELCFENNLITEIDWFDKYVVNTMYKYTSSDYINNIISAFLINNDTKIIWENLTLFFKDIPKLKSSSKSKKIKKPIFCYNYVDMKTLKLSYDNSDLYKDKDRISKIIMRCTIPINNTNNIPSSDAAFINMFGTNILDTYNPKNITICSKINYLNLNNFLPFSIINFFYKKSYIYSKKYTKKLLNNAIISLITISSSDNPSKNKYHFKVFDDDIEYFQSTKSVYYLENNKIQIFENEGYIQCNSMLKSKQNKNNKIIFKIPNISVYKNAKKIMLS